MIDMIEILIADVGNTNLSLVRRLSAAIQVENNLRRELENRCEVLFPDFYWSSSSIFDIDSSPEDYRVRWPQARKWMDLVDYELTPERDAALRSLGFVYLNNDRLGLCEAVDVQERGVTHV